jgi:hypothetical protein
VEKEIKKRKLRNWREKCIDRRLWNEILKQVKTHQVLYRRLKKKKRSSEKIGERSVKTEDCETKS